MEAESQSFRPAKALYAEYGSNLPDGMVDIWAVFLGPEDETRENLIPWAAVEFEEFPFSAEGLFIVRFDTLKLL